MKKTNIKEVGGEVLKKITPLLIGLVVFFVLILSTISYTEYKKDLWENDVRSRMYELLISKKNKLEKALYSRVYYTKSVAAYVSLNPNLSDQEFYNLAQELIDGDSVISTMSLSRNCVLNAVYPLKGHESAIGLNLLEHPERKQIVNKTIKTKKAFIAGPVELVEGGIAFISYTPIFDKLSSKVNNFWGVTDIVIYQNKLLQQASLQIEEDSFVYALRGYNGTGNKGDIWWGSPKVFNNRPVIVSINLPYGTWALGAVPKIGWASYLNQDRVLLIVLIASSLIISILIWLLSKTLFRIRRNEQELNAIIHSMDSLIIEFDKDGRYIKIPQDYSLLLVLPKEQLLNKTVYDVFSEEQAKMFHDAILKCLETKNLQIIDYSIYIKDEEKWFAARISWKTPTTVIYHAYDITEQKLAHEKIIKSEQKYKKLNATKDKLFSIVAHDLKSPLMIVLGYVSLLKEEYNKIDEAERIELIDKINESAQKTSLLLENLFMWAISQRNEMKIIKDQIELKLSAINAIEPYRELASAKFLATTILIDDQLMVYADASALKTIIGNLYNNAIKFTPENGSIAIESFVRSDTVTICISDTGVGMSLDVLNNLFSEDATISTLGTNNEKGTGLGLLICKEFVAKHHGKIWAESEAGIGSKFYFSLPKKQS
ncbi:MAG: CHASE domain-containing protein [Salinivirgaceae bacterium]|nr:CHASE domain-containing protein [Salinivirgaceae bacterium]